MLAVDTNVVVRFLAGDDPDQEFSARAIVEGNRIFVPDTVLLETEWVLRRVLGLDKSRVQQALAAFVGLPQVHVADRQRVAEALHCMAAGVDFADALHVAASSGCEAFLTFDRALVKRSAGLSQVPVALA